MSCRVRAGACEYWSRGGGGGGFNSRVSVQIEELAAESRAEGVAAGQTVHRVVEWSSAGAGAGAAAGAGAELVGCWFSKCSAGGGEKEGRPAGEEPGARHTHARLASVTQLDRVDRQSTLPQTQEDTDGRVLEEALQIGTTWAPSTLLPCTCTRIQSENMYGSLGCMYPTFCTLWDTRRRAMAGYCWRAARQRSPATFQSPCPNHGASLPVLLVLLLAQPSQPEIPFCSMARY